MDFITKLAAAVARNDSLVCVGLDVDPSRIPQGVGVLDFNRAIIKATKDLVCAYKPNLAFYEALGDEGTAILKNTLDFIPDDIPVIGDAKRGDIGNTAKAYARAMFDYLGCDAVTVNPYLGYDAIAPFLEYQEKGIFILCRTSNAGAADFQSQKIAMADGGCLPLYLMVAEKAVEWNRYGNAGLVVGATYPEELKQVRELCPEMPLLIPGVGAQGGNIASVVRYGTDLSGAGAVINSSRNILYASSGADFADAAREAAAELRDNINLYRKVAEAD